MIFLSISLLPQQTKSEPAETKNNVIYSQVPEFKKKKRNYPTDNLQSLFLLWPKSINFSSPRLSTTLVSWPLSACSWPHVLLLFALCSNKIVCVCTNSSNFLSCPMLVFYLWPSPSSSQSIPSFLLSSFCDTSSLSLSLSLLRFLILHSQISALLIIGKRAEILPQIVLKELNRFQCEQP